MAITQERFLQILNAADSLLMAHRTLSAIIRENNSLSSEINSVIANSPDANAVVVMQKYITFATLLQGIIIDHQELTLALMANIMSEKNYFAKNGKANERARYKQAEKRRMEGKAIRQQPVVANLTLNYETQTKPIPPAIAQITSLETSPGINPGINPNIDPKFDKLNQNINEQWAQAQAQAQRPLPATGFHLSKNGVIRHLPPNEDLYAPMEKKDKIF
jgi:hypothetical protein